MRPELRVGKAALILGVVGLLAACQTVPPPPAMSEAGRRGVDPNRGYILTTEIVPMPESATCTAEGPGVQETFTGRTVLALPMMNEPVSITCEADGYGKGRRVISAVAEGQGERAAGTVLMFILAGGAAAGQYANEQRIARTWYPPLVHVILRPDDGTDVTVDWFAERRERIQRDWESYSQRQLADCEATQGLYRYCDAEGLRNHAGAEISALPTAANGRLVTDDDEIRLLFSDRIVGVGGLDRLGPQMQGQFNFRTDGTVVGNLHEQQTGNVSEVNQQSDRGRWRVADGQICVQWQQWDGGAEHCYWVQRSGNTLTVSGPSGSLAGRVSL